MDIGHYIDFQYDLWGNKPLSLLLRLGCTIVKKHHTQYTIKYVSNTAEFTKVMQIGGIVDKNIELYSSQMKTLNMLGLETPYIYIKATSLYLQTKEYVNKSLFEYILKDVTSIPHIFNDINNQLEVYHNNNFIHGNIKPSNVMIDENFKYYLMDSFQYLLCDDNTNCISDTIVFMSPEALKSNEFCNTTDIWGLGCVLYYLLTGNVPFGSTDLYTLVKEILDCNIDLLIIKDEKYREILNRLFKVNPYDRITLKELMIEIYRTNENDCSINELYTAEINKLKNDCKLFRLITNNYYVYPDKIFFPLIPHNPDYKKIIDKDSCESDLFIALQYNLSWFYPEWFQSVYNKNYKKFSHISDGWEYKDRILINYSPYVAQIRKLKYTLYDKKNWGEHELNFKYLTNLKYLNINICTFGIDQLKHLRSISAIYTFSQLKKLKLKFCVITNDIFKGLLKILPVMQNLKNLSFEDNDIEDIGMKYFSNYIYKFPSLISLSFESNPIGERGIDYLSKDISQLTNLQVFDINIDSFGSFVYYLRCNIIPSIFMFDYMDMDINSYEKSKVKLLIKEYKEYRLLSQLVAVEYILRSNYISLDRSILNSLDRRMRKVLNYYESNEIHFDSFRYGTKAVKIALILLISNPETSLVQLRNNDIDDGSLAVVLKSIKFFSISHNISLKIDHNKNIKDINIITLLIKIIMVREIDVSFTSININEILNINVINLICSNNSVNNKVFENLLKKNYHRLLDLSFNKISFCKESEVNDKLLTTLILNSNPLGDRGLESLIKQLHNLPNLKKLCISKCNITDRSAGMLFSNLNGSLNKIEIGYNEIEGKFNNNKVYLKMSKLKMLNLAFNHISTKNIIPILRVFYNKRENVLIIHGNPYDEREIKGLEFKEMQFIKRYYSLLYDYNITTLIDSGDLKDLPDLLPEDNHILDLCSSIFDCYLYKSNINYFILLLNILLINPSIHDKISNSLSKCDNYFHLLLLDHVEDYGYLGLDNLKLNDDDISELCEIMGGLKYLKKINLSNNLITMNGLNTIMKSMYKFDMLEECIFKGNSVDGSKTLETMNSIYSHCNFIY